MTWLFYSLSLLAAFLLGGLVVYVLYDVKRLRRLVTVPRWLLLLFLLASPTAAQYEAVHNGPPFQPTPFVYGEELVTVTIIWELPNGMCLVQTFCFRLPSIVRIEDFRSLHSANPSEGAVPVQR